MLVNNMEAVFKVFFSGVSVLRVKSKRAAQKKERRGKYDHIE